MKIGITAVTGNLGEVVALTFIKKVGIENIVGFARNIEKANALFKGTPLEKLTIREADYCKPELCEKAFEGITHLVVISVSNPAIRRVRQHRNVIQAAIKANVYKILYTSIVGKEDDTGFQDIVLSNHITEEDIEQSGLKYTIARNSLYLEPDLDFVESYVKDNNQVANSAGSGKCAFTSRYELAEAYYHMLTKDEHNGKIYELGGQALTQDDVCNLLNKHFNVKLHHKRINIQEFTDARVNALGSYLGTIIGGIYHSISKGYFDISTNDFKKIVGRDHKTPDEMVEAYKARGKQSRAH